MRKAGWNKPTPRSGNSDAAIEEFHVQKQHTAGAYQTIWVAHSRAEAVAHMRLLASKEGVHYDGGDKFQTSNNKHNCTRYRIMPFKAEPLFEEAADEDESPEMPWDCAKHFG